jgi:hypothetical protein
MPSRCVEVVFSGFTFFWNTVTFSAMLAEKAKKLEEEFARMDRNAEVRAERQIAMGADQGWRRGARRGPPVIEEVDDIFAEDSHAKLAGEVIFSIKRSLTFR